MSFLKRAVLYLTRKKGRTVLLMALLLLMSCFVLLGISFQESAKGQADSLRKSLASGFILKANEENEMYREHFDYEQGGGASVYVGPTVTDEMIGKILSLDGVKDYSVRLSNYANTDLRLKPGAWADAEADDEETIAFAKKVGAGWMTAEELEAFRQNTVLYPCRNGSIHKNFRTGALTITQRRNIEEGDHFKAVISEWLARENGLSVGDTFIVETKEGVFQFSEEPLKTWGEPVELEIVGLFKTNFSQEPSEYTYEDCYADNTIYTDLDTHAILEKNQKNQNDGHAYEWEGYGEVEFFVEDPSEVDAIMQRVRNWEELDLNNIDVVVDSSAYQAAVKPYQRIRILAMALLIVGLLGIGVILYLVLKLWVQGRRREVGVLFSIGIKKGGVFGQMLTECLMVSAMALVLAFVLSGPMLARCAGALERMNAPKAGVEAYEAATGGYVLEITKTSSDEVVLGHDVSMGTALFTALFVCGVSALSVCMSFGGIRRLEPKKMMQWM